FETGGQRRGFFQPGVRRISDSDFRQIIAAGGQPTVPVKTNQVKPDSDFQLPRYASPEVNRAVEAFALRVALDEVSRRFPGWSAPSQPRNNPGFDVLVRRSGEHDRYIEVKGTTRLAPQFFITEGEIQFSRAHRDNYHLLVVFGIDVAKGLNKMIW